MQDATSNFFLPLSNLPLQAIFYHLRTTRDEMLQVRRQTAQRLAMENAANPSTTAPAQNAAPGPDGTAQASPQQVNSATANAQDGARPAQQEPPHLRQAWACIDEIVQILKTAFPLLILSLETMVEQLNTRFKGNPEEEIYRLISMLLQDAIQVMLAISTLARPLKSFC